MNTFLLSDFFLLDIKENWIEFFHLLDEESKVIEDEEKEGRKRNRDQFTLNPRSSEQGFSLPHHRELLVTLLQEQLGKHQAALGMQERTY